MNRFPIRLSSPDLEQLIDFLKTSIANHKRYGYTKQPNDKLIIAALAELLHKLSSANNCFKNSYKMQINVSQGLALVVHCNRVKAYVFDVDHILINNIIGIVDQKTA